MKRGHRVSLTCELCGAAFDAPHGIGNHRRWHRGPTVLARFMAKVDATAGLFGCWPWTGLTDAEGYGKLWVDGRNRRANRLALAIALGRELADEECALHACDNPVCARVGPGHLFVGTNADNIADRHAKGRDPRGERNRHAKLTTAQAIEVRRRMAAGGRSRLLAAEFGVSQSAVAAIAAGKTWKHLWTDPRERAAVAA